MNTLTITLPDSLHCQFQQLAEREGISMDQLAALALTEKIAALMTTDYLAKRTHNGSRSQFEQALASVADVEPQEYDRLP